MPVQDSEKQLVQQQIKSGQTVSKFCSDNNLKTHQLCYYKSVPFPSEPKNKPAFVKVLETKPIEEIEPARIVLYFKELSLSFEGNHDPQAITDLCVLLSAQE